MPIFNWGTPPSEEEKKEKVRVNLRKDLSKLHEAFTNNHSTFNGVRISVDVESRVNVTQKLKEVKDGTQKLPFRWYCEGNYVTITSSTEMQQLYDLIFRVIRKSYQAKDYVLDIINQSSTPEYVDVLVEWSNAFPEDDSFSEEESKHLLDLNVKLL